MHTDDDVVEMHGLQNTSPVTDAKSWVNPRSPGAASKSSYFQNFDREEEFSQARRRRNAYSLYDYGLGSFSMRSIRTNQESVQTSPPTESCVLSVD